MNAHHLTRILRHSTALLILTCCALGETFHLKDGRVLDARIVTQNEDSYVLSVLVARGIRDEIAVKKEDVLKIERVHADQKAFKELKPLLPIPDMLSAEEYNQRIENIRNFISDFAYSSHLNEANEILEAHLDELKTIEIGGIKLDGIMIHPDQYLADKYNIDSKVAAGQISRTAQTSGLLSALRAFHEFESEFSGSEAWHELLPFVRQLAATHKTQVQELLANYDARVARRETGLSRMSQEDRLASQRAIDARAAADFQRYTQERALRNFWPTISRDFKPSMEDTIRFADQEIRRLSMAHSQPLRSPSPSQVWRNAFSALESENISQARSAVQQARSARMPARYIQTLQSMLDDLVKRAEEERKRQQEEARRQAEEARRQAEEARQR